MGLWENAEAGSVRRMGVGKGEQECCHVTGETTIMINGDFHMRESKTPRAIAAVFLGLLLGAYKHYQQIRSLTAGRQAYLAEQNLYFDKITKTHSMGFMLIACVILAVIAVGLYEAIAYGFGKVIRPVEVEE